MDIVYQALVDLLSKYQHQRFKTNKQKKPQHIGRPLISTPADHETAILPVSVLQGRLSTGGIDQQL